MPTLTEQVESRQRSTGENASVTLKYILDGTSDDVAARLLATASTATTYDGLVRQGIDLEPIDVDSTVGAGKWNVSVRYGPKPAPTETGDMTYQFDTGGATQHITQAWKHVNHYACANQTAETFSGAIGVTGSGTNRSVEGVDIVVPCFTWSETWNLTDAQVNRAAYYALTGKVNNSAWKGFAEGEVLFLGASGSKKGSDNWEVTFKYSASPNVTNFCADWPVVIRPAAAVPKKGWEVASVYYRVSEGTQDLIPKPIQVDINQVYQSGDFSTLPPVVTP